MCASPQGAPAAILAVSPSRIDARANLKGGCLRRFCRRRNFERHCSRVIVADSPLKTELPGVYMCPSYISAVLKGQNVGASRGRAVLTCQLVGFGLGLGLGQDGFDTTIPRFNKYRNAGI
jgi:hypothetical protein